MRPVFTSLSPNTEADDIRLALRLVFSPWRWMDQGSVERLEEAFSSWSGVPGVLAFASGRGALYAILRAFGISKGDEVLLQAYTCVAVPGPVLWTGARPVYVDVKDNFTMDPRDLERKITTRSRAVIIQHTFGHRAATEQIVKIAKDRGMLVIEDCAHVMGDVSEGKHPLLGDAAFWSFGRDKACSSVFGGVAVVKERVVAQELRTIRDSFTRPSRAWMFQQLVHPLVFAVAKPTYFILGIGKMIVEAAKRLHIISKAVISEERRGEMPGVASRKMPGALAEIALLQFRKKDRFSLHRRETAGMYERLLEDCPGVTLPPLGEGDIPLRYTVGVGDPGAFISAAKRQKIELGNWYDVPVAPTGVDGALVGYDPGSCPRAEGLASESLNLPTHIGITVRDAERVADVVKKYAVQAENN